MKYIYKYKLAIEDNPVIAMPVGAKTISAGGQNGELVIWAEVDLPGENRDRYFVILGTGMEIPCRPIRFINTVQMKNGLVWHVYEVGTK